MEAALEEKEYGCFRMNNIEIVCFYFHPHLPHKCLYRERTSHTLDATGVVNGKSNKCNGY